MSVSFTCIWSIVLSMAWACSRVTVHPPNPPPVIRLPNTPSTSMAAATSSSSSLQLTSYKSLTQAHRVTWLSRSQTPKRTWHSYGFNDTSGSCGSPPWVCRILWRLLSLRLQQLERSSLSPRSRDELSDRLHHPVCPSPLKWQVRSKHHAQGSYVNNGLASY